MKFISWNVNGLRAVCGKGFSEAFAALDADFFCLQETKMQEGQIDITFPGYQTYWSYAKKKGYSGTAIFTKHQPLNVTYGLSPSIIEKTSASLPVSDTPNKEDWATVNSEGRVITLEYDTFFVVTVYTPNSQDELRRLDLRMIWDDAFRSYIQELDSKKPVLVCGDLNVAHQEIDLKNPKSNRKNAGFTDEERDKFSTLLSAGFTDTFRHFYPDKTEIYSWWSYRFKAREKNAGWRIDYWICSNRISPLLQSATIHTDIMGSDHCPVEVVINI